MTKEQLIGLRHLIKCLNALRSNFADTKFEEVECILDEDLFNKLIVECPYPSSAWELSLMVDHNSTISIDVVGRVVTFS